MLIPLFKWIDKYRHLVLLACFTGTVFFVSDLKDLKIKTNLLDMLPADFEAVKSVKEIAEITGGIGYYIVVAEGSDRQKNIDYLTRFSEKAAGYPEILYVDFRQPSEFIEKNGVLWLPLQELRVMHNDLKARIDYFRKKAVSLLPDEMGPPPPFRTKELLKEVEKRISRSPYAESSDGNMVITVLKPTIDSTDVDFTKSLAAKMDLLAQEISNDFPEVKVSHTGFYRVRSDQTISLEKGLLQASLFTIIGVSLALTFFFRSAKVIMIAFLPLGFGILWALIINYHVVGHLNLISSFFISILMGLGIDYSLQLYARFKEEYIKSRDYYEALNISYLTTGKGVVLGALTTFSVFCILIFSDFQAFKETGILSAVGIISMLVSIAILLPVFVFIFKPRFSWFEDAPEKKHLEEQVGFSIRLMNFIHKNRILLVLVCVIVGVFGAFFIQNNKFEYNFLKLEDVNAPSRLMFHRMGEVFGVDPRPTIFMVHSLEELDELRKVIDREARKEGSDIARHYSILDYYPYPEEDLTYRVKTVNKIRELLLKNIDNMERSDQQLVYKYLKYLYPKPTKIEDYPLSIKNAVLGEKDDKRVYFYLVLNRSDLGMGVEAMEFSKELLEIQKEVSSHPALASEIIFLNEMVNMIISEGKVILPAVFITILLMTYLLFRKIKNILIILLPLIVGLLYLAQFLGFTHVIFQEGVSLNYFNVVMIPILLGVGVDYAIHIFHRLEEAYHNEEKTEKERWLDVTQTSYALLISAITTIIGFCSLFFASYRGLRSIAWVSVIGIILILIASAVLIPAVFFIVDPKARIERRRKKERQQKKHGLLG